MMKNILKLILILNCLNAFGQTGVLQIRQNDILRLKQYPKIISDTTNNELHFYLANNKKQPVGIYLTKYELGYWNSTIDTFALDDSTLIIFINPFPDIVLKQTNEIISENQVNHIGIGPFIYEKDENGLFLSICLGKTDKGTMKVYFNDPLTGEVGYIEHYLKGELIDNKMIDQGKVVLIR